MIRIQGWTQARAAVALVVALAATALALVASPTAAQAAAPRTNCIADLTGRTPLKCFATFTEAMSAASGGRYADAPATWADAFRDSGLAAKINTANAGAQGRAGITSNIVISLEYDLRDHDGEPLIWYGDRECSTRTTDVDYQIANYNVSAPSWVNRISSFLTYGNCWTKHFENTNFGGASVGFQSSRTYIGAAMDNRTSSEQWS